MNICIIGLGYVGLPLAVLCAKKGHKVIGYDINETIVEKINQGISTIQDVDDLCGIKATTDPKEIEQSEIFVVCVPTPVDAKHMPNLSPVKSAVRTVSEHMHKGSLVILESTINPGVSEDVVKPLLDKKGTDGKDYFLAHCPERINPGDKQWNVENLPRVLGSTTEQGLEKAYTFYRSILSSDIKKMSSIKTAEAVKIVENSFRDINIAFVNELAKGFDKLQIDVLEVINGAATKPFGFMPHYPSCGVGGHCIPVDPYYLIERGNEVGFNHSFLKLAREINNSMPQYAVDQLTDGLNSIEKSIKGTTIGILGVSYKGDVSDLRESPSFEIIELLEKKGAQLKIYDPFVPEKSNCTKTEALACDAIILCTNHTEFKEYDYSQTKVLVDGKNFLDRDMVPNHIVYKGIGK
jgi:UDP-N-acetyl-D-glucosamine dehydrogenase